VSERAGYTFTDVEDAQLLAPATVACFSHSWAAETQPVKPATPTPHVPFQNKGRDTENNILETSGLTQRERDIVDRVIAGDRNSDLATYLGISIKTVENHLSNVFSKTNTRSRQDLILSILRGS